jgi:hypothetical protein
LQLQLPYNQGGILPPMEPAGTAARGLPKKARPPKNPVYGRTLI